MVKNGDFWHFVEPDQTRPKPDGFGRLWYRVGQVGGGLGTSSRQLYTTDGQV